VRLGAAAPYQRALEHPRATPGDRHLRGGRQRGDRGDRLPARR
jgi:hypothetical protein